MDIETEEILAEPEATIDILASSSEVVKSYGWYILVTIVIIGINWHRIQKYLDRWYDKRESAKYAAKYHKNPDLALERLEGIEKARRKMQEELNRKAKEHEEKIKERERQLLEKIDANTEEEHRLGNEQPSTSKGLRPDYNPLMGNNSRRYIPKKKSGCPGGGCGR